MKVAYKCVCCGLRFAGRELTDGTVRADDGPPSGDGDQRAGVCGECAEQRRES